MTAVAPSLPTIISGSDPIMERIEEQIQWYDRKSATNHQIFKRIKVAEILAAALIPFCAVVNVSGIMYFTAALGVLVTVFEGLLHLNQYQQNWITYRATCEALRHEKYLFLAHAGHYANAAEPHQLLAEQIESLISQEQAKWISVQQQESKPKPI